jgi:hypothetical protein
MSTEIFVGLYRLTTAHYADEKVTICYSKEGGQGPEIVLNKSPELTITLGGQFSLVIQEIEGVVPPIAPSPGFPEFPLAPAPGRPVTLPGGFEAPPQGPSVQPRPPEGFLPPIGTLPPWFNGNLTGLMPTLPPWFQGITPGLPGTYPQFPIGVLPQMPSNLMGMIPPWYGAGYPVTLPGVVPGTPVTLPGGPEPLPGGPAVQPKPDVDGTTKPNPRPEGPDAGDLTKPGVPLAKPA